MDEAASIAADLLEIGAVKLQTQDLFTWASGLRSPIYTDNRVALAYPEVRNRICAGLVRLAKSLGALDAVVGVATAGIPHAALVADRLSLPLAYVRASAKQHGRQNRIEGRLQAGDRVVLIEDLISTGGSSLEAVEALREAGVAVVATLAIFSYGFEAAHRRFVQAGCPLHTLTNYTQLVTEAERRGYVAAADLEVLQTWRTETSNVLA